MTGEDAEALIGSRVRLRAPRRSADGTLWGRVDALWAVWLDAQDLLTLASWDGERLRVELARVPPEQVRIA